MLQSAKLATLPGVRHGFFTRVGGVSEGIYESLNGGVGSNDNPTKVAENRARMAQQIGISPDHLLSCHQIHSPDVVVVDKPWAPTERPRADAMVTRMSGFGLAIATADCGPVLLADPQARVIGAAHAGWRGALTGVIEATVSAMEQLGAERRHMVAAAGPMIRQPNYEVGQEMMDRFVLIEPNTVRFFKKATRDGHAMFDLGGYIASRLRRARIEQIDDLGHCTYADAAQFYSYRRATHSGESDYGRHLNVIALVE